MQGSIKLKTKIKEILELPYNKFDVFVCLNFSQDYNDLEFEFRNFKKYRIFSVSKLLRVQFNPKNTSWWDFNYINLIEVKKLKKQFLKQILNNKFMNLTREDLILQAAKALISVNNKTTTLEIKDHLIQDFPEYYWGQTFISQTMIDNEKNFSYTDNGNYRTYLDKNQVKVRVKKSDARPIHKVSVTKLASLIDENKGKFLTIIHIKQADGSKNLMNCQILKSTVLGTILVTEQGKKKSFYPTDLLEVRVKGEVYVKK
jgi:hypothetical protein